MSRHVGLTSLLLLFAVATNAAATDRRPQMLAYSAQPNGYFNQHAADIAKIYDGFFFVIGDWDTGVAQQIGFPDTPASTKWKEAAKENLGNLNAVGVTENFLSVYFAADGAWPSPDALRSDEFTAKMAKHFGALAAAAKELGFRGVSIDLEYPYPRYELTHEVYKYDGYTADDLTAAAAKQGRAVMTAMLDAFPEITVMVLPGELTGRPISRVFQVNLINVMAERKAPGGYHLGYERSYCLYDPASQAAIPREADCVAKSLLEPATLEYWRRYCTVAPGVWPTHRVETGSKEYPQQPWAAEMAELKGQMATLRALAKRYIWSFSGQPVWYAHTPELEQKYGLTKQTFDGVDEAIPAWHKILAEPAKVEEPRLANLIYVVKQFDEGRLPVEALCDRFGTPSAWMILGPLGNPRTLPQFTATAALSAPVRTSVPWQGRDGAVHWFPHYALDPLGTFSLKQPFDYRNTDNASAHAVVNVTAPAEVKAQLWMNWDDGVVVRLGDKVIFDKSDYPETGHGILFKDHYLFEEHVPVTIPKGTTRLSVTSLNLKGSWGFNLRFADEDGYPVKGLAFTLPK